MRLGGGRGAREEMAAGTTAHVQPASLKLVSSRCPAGAAVLCWKDLLPSPLTGRSAKTATWLPGHCPVFCHPNGPDQATQTHREGTP